MGTFDAEPWSPSGSQDTERSEGVTPAGRLPAASEGHKDPVPERVAVEGPNPSDTSPMVSSGGLAGWPSDSDLRIPLKAADAQR